VYEYYHNMCGVYGCWEVYRAQHPHTPCPKCGISQAEIVAFGTNDMNVINEKKIDKEIGDLYNDALGG
jgi:hypothetical protein